MIEIKSNSKLPFIFKECKSGFLIKDGKMFVSGEYKQSLTDYQFQSLQRFSTLEKAKAVAMPKKETVIEENKEEAEEKEKKEEEIKVKTNIPKKNKKGKK